MIPYLKLQLAGILTTAKLIFSRSSGYMIKVLGALWLFLAGIHTFIFAVITLTLVDVVSGVIAALKKGEKFSSRKFRKGLLEKTALYLVLLLSVFSLDLVVKSVINLESFYFSSMITFLIATYEISSIMENLNSIHPIPFLSALNNIFTKMNKKTTDDIEKKVDVIVDGATELKIGPDKPSADVKH